MSIVTSQQLARYHEQHGTTEVTFTREVGEATGLVARNLYLKVSDQQWPCIIYSCSMRAAKVIASVRNAFFDSLRKSNSHVSLRLCFRLPDKAEPISFFVPCHAAAFTPYNPQNPDVQIISLEFTQRPPDDLILILGTLLEANATAKRRREERIVLTAESVKKLGIEWRDTTVEVDGARRRCILRDLSFSGARVLVGGIAAGLEGRSLTLRVRKGEQADDMAIAGVVRRTEDVQGRTDIRALGIEYTSEPPMSYKLMISGYLASPRSGNRTDPRSGNRTEERKPAPPVPGRGVPRAPARPAPRQAEPPSDG
jgi:hypothetical protein